MDLAQIRELLQTVAQSDVAEVEIEEEGFRVVVRKQAPSVMMQAPMPFAYPQAGYMPPAYAPPPQAYPAPQTPPAAAPTPPAAPAAPAEAPAEAPAAASSGKNVKAPIVGTFYRAPAPDADPFVEGGDKVKPGDVLCIIEAMKLMNEIEAEFGGTVTEILVENAQPVEFDQPLFVIDPS